jgi:septal ring factor EnvC (AmiA/AmiB activator)
MYQDLKFPFCLYDAEDYNLKNSLIVYSQAEYDILDKDRWLKYHDAKEIQDSVNERIKQIDQEIEATNQQLKQIEKEPEEVNSLGAEDFEQNTDAGEVDELNNSGIDLKSVIYPITMVNTEGETKICGTRRTAEKWLAEGWLPK